MTVDWNRAMIEKTTVGKKKVERIIYKDETKSCSSCAFYLLDRDSRKTKPECSRKFTISSYSRACVMHVEGQK